MGTVTALLQAGADNLCIRCRYLGRGLPWNTVTDRCASCSLRSIEPGMRHRSAADFFARAFSYRQTSPVARQGSRVDLAASGRDTGRTAAGVTEQRHLLTLLAATFPSSIQQKGFCNSGLVAQSEEREASSEAETSSRDRDTAEDPFLQSITTTAGPAAYYKENRASGVYKKDPKQESTILKLQQLYDNLKEAVKGQRRRSGLTLVDHAGTTQGHRAWWQDIGDYLSNKSAPAQPEMPKVKGLYMFGGVGTGKTMLMDLLVNSAPPQFKLRRLHFHDFMLEVHSQLRKYTSQADPLVQVADAAVASMRVLCLDELFVTDVADAAILNRLFGRMWDRGLVLVATSNRHPDDLYKGGLQRELFLPFIARLKQETEVHNMESPVDYRRLAHHRKGISFIPDDGPDPDEELTRHFAELAAAAGGAPPAPRQIAVQMGRKLDVPLAGANMCLMTFEELCAKNLGAADYIALAGAFHTLALRGIPIFNNSTRSEAYRFVTLIDVLYEQRIRILCSAAALPQVLFSKVMSQQEAKDARNSGQGSDDVIVDDNLAFSKDRTISRMTEMESTEYLLEHARRHAPCLVLALEEQGGAEKVRRYQAAAAA